ncbi:hypothetical protein CDSE_0148 [Candidatus Kinetoplastibacterium desouzaii TCC079E]|uniref:Lipoprotein n=1 Tax=Candidatus Kinetoplastidibacterium desouzai TCC079E TaxID=1208919 RepID=M1L3F4_9PROT|nr:hypothetical protein CDSE_0148 [Candidatus Kinetoplastibacterium desouzaii TCC079E]
MKYKNKLFTIITIIFLSSLLNSCGYKGQLYIETMQKPQNNIIKINN